jgi:FlaA1/EpsC-like NDP-sugar epimerase
MRLKNANALIIADKSLSIADKIIIVDRCLEYNIKVFTLPAISDWEDANEISRKVKNIEIADLLEVEEGIPIILFRGTTYGMIGNKEVPIESFKTNYRTDKYKFYINQVKI